MTPHGRLRLARSEAVRAALWGLFGCAIGQHLYALSPSSARAGAVQAAPTQTLPAALHTAVALGPGRFSTDQVLDAVARATGVLVIAAMGPSASARKIDVDDRHLDAGALLKRLNDATDTECVVREGYIGIKGHDLCFPAYAERLRRAVQPAQEWRTELATDILTIERWFPPPYADRLSQGELLRVSSLPEPVQAQALSAFVAMSGQTRLLNLDAAERDEWAFDFRADPHLEIRWGTGDIAHTSWHGLQGTPDSYVIETTEANRSRLVPLPGFMGEGD